jgi:putative methyltransferase
MSATFSAYTQTLRLADIMSASPEERIVYVDQHIPDLLALPPGIELTKTEAYKNGQLVLQDKASCFPAFLLFDDLDNYDQGDILDACAAPGNKTSHLASILSHKPIVTDSDASDPDPKIFACERDPYRSQTLQKMVKLAGAESVVTVLAKQDFLALDPTDARFKNVTHLLLDPSCSGSGIVGRDEVPVLQLPADPKLKMAGPTTVHEKTLAKGVSKKRKRENDSKRNGKFGGHGGISALQSSDLESEEVPREVDFARLERLANLQTKIIEHGFSFPRATRITYSTCSIHVQENEAVVSRALSADVARNRGWRVMRQEQQPDGMRRWPHRGLDLADVGAGDIDSSQKAALHSLSEEERRACIRCQTGDEEGTMGFFVCGFIREEKPIYANGARERNNGETMSHGEGEEWGGFSDDGDV